MLSGKTFSDAFFISAGVALLISLAIIHNTGDLTLWITAKVFYGLAALLYVLNR